MFSSGWIATDDIEKEEFQDSFSSGVNEQLQERFLLFTLLLSSQTYEELLCTLGDYTYAVGSEWRHAGTSKVQLC